MPWPQETNEERREYEAWLAEQETAGEYEAWLDACAEADANLAAQLAAAERKVA